MLDLLKTGSFISEMRKDKGLTQKQLADLVGVSDKAVSRWETGKGLPDTSIMPELCKALDINVNELLSGERLNAEAYSGKAEEIMVDLVKDVQNNNKARKLELLGLILGLLLLLIGLFGIMIVGGSEVVYFIDPPSFIMVLAIQLIILAASGQIGCFIKAFKYVFRKKTLVESELAEDVAKCEYAIKIAQKSALLGGAISSIIGFVTVFAIVWRKAYDVLGPNMAVAVLSLFYGVLFALLLIPIQGRLHNMK
ncbi:Helix-turn-helix [Pseudobutyrivibrio sp. 49]|uniref:helix-turn-helix domain-containing protein n=1 Tax=unclassified Pseudobutyrivibrio TaxID=2638619 RepID=UPI00088DBBC2|nr:MULTISPECIES: helix-turn-helix transcriptional regulator [unclassified Pseudobutyrivibrio]SDI19454.1 Helix-turn-helix [Pseudobutyrivibrio sp. 49]SFN61006.1 Helix-turn-helix domain-containing protein [Pseudobutyrivibrio sp. UC1225]